MATIVHPRLFEKLTRHHYASVCTIQEFVETTNSAGEIIRTAQTLAGHDAIRCQISRPGLAASGQEVRRETSTYLTQPRIISLAGYYPQITEKMQAVIESIAYNIQDVLHDSQRSNTSLRVELVR